MTVGNEMSWNEWVTHNVSRGCSCSELHQILIENGFDLDRAAELLGPAAESPQSGLHLPTALRVETSRAELYGIDGFLSDEECVRIITLIKKNLRPSTTTEEGVSDFRTSQTCELASLDDPFVKAIDERICRFMGIDIDHSEPIQGQWYEVGQEFKPHTDYFQPGSPSYAHHAVDRGQRSWTFMIYLNTTRQGGSTDFPELNLNFRPQAGTAVIWNNLDLSGNPNPATWHHAMPVEKGFKVVITKWFRSNNNVIDYNKEANEYLPSLTRSGFMKSTIPLPLYQKLLSFYQSNRSDSAAESIPEYIKSTCDATPSMLVALTDELRRQVHATLQPILEAWIGDYLAPTYVYGIREYSHGSVLKPHRDRTETHVASAILNIYQDANSDWPLMIEDHQYRQHEVILKTGEMVLYEGARLEHGRPNPFDGKYFANVFVHYRLAD